RREERERAVQRRSRQRIALRQSEDDKCVVLVSAKLKVRLDAGDLALHFANQLADAGRDRLVGLLLALELVDLGEQFLILLRRQHHPLRQQLQGLSGFFTDDDNGSARRLDGVQRSGQRRRLLNRFAFLGINQHFGG